MLLLNDEVPAPFSASVTVLAKSVSVLLLASRATTTGSVVKSSCVPEVRLSGDGWVVYANRVAVMPTTAAAALLTAALLPDMLEPLKADTSVSPSSDSEKDRPAAYLSPLLPIPSTRSTRLLLTPPADDAPLDIGHTAESLLLGDWLWVGH